MIIEVDGVREDDWREGGWGREEGSDVGGDRRGVRVRFALLGKAKVCGRWHHQREIQAKKS